MGREIFTAVAKKPVAYYTRGSVPYIPATDNEPGAPEALLKANRSLRERRWPQPYDRTRHEMILGDARDLSTIASESVHLIVTSPPYFNLKAYASDAGGVS
jgi:modification methylase